MVKVIRNVGGVSGLDVALDCFPEEIERRLFSSSILFPHTPHQSSQMDKERHGVPTGPWHWDADVWKLCNLVRDTFPQCNVPPDYCLALSYPQGAGFKSHLDSRYRWGECIVGVSLGQASVMYFEPNTDEIKERGPPHQKETSLTVRVKTYDSRTFGVEVELPRRSIYVMRDQVRMDWKHGIRQQTPKRLTSFPIPPPWNMYNLRRSLTFRATKAYSDAYLENLLKGDPSNQLLQNRIKEQSKFRPQGDYGGKRLTDEELAQERRKAERTLQMMLNSPLRDARFQGNDTRDSEEEQLQAAIRLSLQSPVSGSASEPICLDSDDDNEEDVTNNSSGTKRALPDEKEDDGEGQERMRLARLRRFDKQS